MHERRAISRSRQQWNELVADRRDVLIARRRLGFGVDARREHFVVVQSDLASDLDTVVVIPLDEDAPMYRGDPLVVSVSAKEAGTSKPQVALTYLLRAMPRETFDASPGGRVVPRTMRAIDTALRALLEI